MNIPIMDGPKHSYSLSEYKVHFHKHKTSSEVCEMEMDKRNSRSGEIVHFIENKNKNKPQWQRKGII